MFCDHLVPRSPVMEGVAVPYLVHAESQTNTAERISPSNTISFEAALLDAVGLLKEGTQAYQSHDVETPFELDEASWAQMAHILATTFGIIR